MLIKGSCSLSMVSRFGDSRSVKSISWEERELLACYDGIATSLKRSNVDVDWRRGLLRSMDCEKISHTPSAKSLKMPDIKYYDE